MLVCLCRALDTTTVFRPTRPIPHSLVERGWLPVRGTAVSFPWGSGMFHVPARHFRVPETRSGEQLATSSDNPASVSGNSPWTIPDSATARSALHTTFSTAAQVVPRDRSGPIGRSTAGGFDDRQETAGRAAGGETRPSRGGRGPEAGGARDRRRTFSDASLD